MICSLEFIPFWFRRSAAWGTMLVLGLASAMAQSTDIAIETTALQPSVKRLGINLSFQDFYDSGQMTKNLVSRNPGFEGEIYHSTIRCASGTATTCIDDDPNSAWPNSFWNGATVEFFYGSAQGRTGTVASYTAANNTTGGTFTFSSAGAAPATGDYMIVRMTVPGNAAAGWWPTTSGAGAITTNSSDLPPGTAGLQTAAVSAPAAGDSAILAAYFDGVGGRSFVLLNGTFQLSFKAKGTGGSNAIALNLSRLGMTTYLNQTVNLTNAWTTYTFNFSATESGSNLSNVGLSFSTVGQDSFLIDDVSLTQTNSDPSNPTAFRDPVVNTLKTLNPGVLRFWALQLGDTLDNLIAPQYGRQRSGYLAWYSEQDDISYGLPEFLQLCQTVGAEPWIVVPSTFSTTEAANLIEYLAGAASTPYGSERVASGYPSPWTSAFTKIHLEFGNEAWNSAFKGGSIEYSAPYGQRAQAIFGAMRGNGSFNPSAFDLVLGGQATWPGRNQDIQNSCNNNDSFAIAPYMMNTVNSFSTNEDLFGSTFAEPEAFISPSGVAEGLSGGLLPLNQQALAATSHPVPVSIYEANLSTTSGTITQTALNSYVSSLGAGLAVADSMLQQMRQGVITQNLFALPQYEFARPDGSTVFLWGSVVDMGVTDLRRPQFLATQLANQAIGNNSAMVQTVHTGVNPTWNQPLVNSVQLSGAHYLQSFAFVSGSTVSLVVFNLHRSSSLPVTFSGPYAPGGTVQMQQLTSAQPTDTNETSAVVNITTQSLASFNPSSGLSLPPYSMTVLSWIAVNPLPVISSVSSTAITSTSATIAWTTDQPSSSQVEYGTTSGYGTLSANTATLVTSHSVTLTGLTPGTAYDYAVMSTGSGGTATSPNFTFSTLASALPSVISRVGGAHNNTATNNSLASLAIPYSSQGNNTIVAVCALGNTSTSISSITDTGGSTWAQRAYVINGTAVRSEIWSTGAGGSAAATSFAINLSSGGPMSCALEEYSGVQSIGSPATNTGTSNTVSVSLVTQNANDYVVAGLGANSYNGLNATAGSIWQAGGITSNSVANFVEMSLCDNTSASAAPVACTAVFGSSPWAAPALDLSAAGPTSLPVISAVASGGLTTTSATITWTTDLASSSQVAYGITTAYGSQSTLAAAPVTSHSVNLTGLAPGTTYDFEVLSTNSAGTTTSTNFTFSTLALAVISAVASSGLTATSATITWTTDLASSSQVAYGTSTAYGSLSTLNAASVTAHSVNLSGLAPGTTYDFEVLSTNSAGTATSANFTFSTPASIPVISTVVSGGLTTTSVTITWSTDQASSSQVSYGTTTAYGSLSTLNATPVTSHSVNLTGLTAGTAYDFEVLSTNSAGTATSTNFTFSTPASLPVISAVASGGLTATSATISWATDQASSSQVAYGTTTAYGSLSTLNATPTTSHSVNLTGLTPGTTYDFEVLSTNSAGTATSTNFTFSTPASVPVISAVASGGLTTTSATINWSTDQASSSQVAYGTTTAYGSLSTLIATPVTSHSVNLTGLTPGTAYDFEVLSTNSAGIATSTNFTFSTPALAPVISAVTSSGVTSTSAIITWTTDQASSSEVEYGTTIGYGALSAYNPVLATSHSVTLTGLIPGATYDYAALSANAAGTLATSSNFTFATQAAPPVLKNVTVSAITATSATIVWTTDQASSSQVAYGTTTAYGSLSTLNSSLVTSHSVNLTGLVPGTTYNFEAISTNSVGLSNGSANATFVTGSGGPAPIIQSLAYWGITGSGLTVSWSTDQSSDTAIEYGTTPALGQVSPIQTTLSTGHGIVLNGLSDATTYYFRARSTNASNVSGYSVTYSFTTLDTTPPVISNIQIGSNVNNAAIASWMVSKAATSQVEFGTSTNYGSWVNASASFPNQQATLWWVPSGTIHFRIHSTDASGNQAVSPDYTFIEP